MKTIAVLVQTQKRSFNDGPSLSGARRDNTNSSQHREALTKKAAFRFELSKLLLLVSSHPVPHTLRSSFSTALYLAEEASARKRLLRLVASSRTQDSHWTMQERLLVSLLLLSDPLQLATFVSQSTT